MAQTKVETVEKDLLTIETGNGRIIVRSITNSKGTKVDIRQWFLPEDGEDYIPTRKGVRLTAEQAKKMAQAVAKVKA